MANAIDLIVTKEALQGLDALYEKLEKSDQLALKASADFLAMNKSISGVKTPGDLDAFATKNANLTTEVDRLTKANINLQRQYTAVTAAVNSNAKGNRDNAVASQILRAETDRNFRANTLLGGAYARASAQLLILKKNIKDAAIAFGEESTQVKVLQAEFAGLDGRIRAADKVAGDFQRNVGNYSNGVVKGFQSIFASVRQLAYILPGIGIAGIFSLALDPLFDLIKGMDLFKKKTNELVESRKQLNEISKEATKNATDELIKLQGNLAIARDINLSYKERMIAVKNLQDSYPFYFENLTKEQILAGDTAKAERALTEAILSRARANAAVGKITENQGKIIDLEEERLTLVSDLSRAEAQAASDSARAARGNEAAAISNLQSADRIASAKRKIANLDKEITAIQSINNRLTTYSIANQEKAIGLDYKAEKAKKERVKEEKRANEIAVNTLTRNQSFLEVLEGQVKIFQEVQKEVSDTSEEYESFNKVIKGLQQSIDLIKDPSKVIKGSTDEFIKQQKAIDDTNKSIQKAKEILADYTDTFSEGFFSNAGLSTAFDILSGKIKGFGTDTATTILAATESFKEFFNFVNKASQQNFDAEKERLESQLKISIQYAGENEVAKAELEKQGEARRKDIQRRELIAQKQIARFNTILDTAQAIISAFANPGGVAGIALAALAAVTGAIQLSAINAQQIPQLWKGGITPGGVVMVNDNPGGVKGSNYKEVIKTPSGNVIKPQGKNVLMNLPKGSEVFPNYNSWEQHLNSMLYGSGIEPLKGVMNYEARQQSNGFPIESFNATASRIENAVSSIPGISLDESGFKKWNRSQGQRSIVMNNRLNQKGKINP